MGLFNRNQPANAQFSQRQVLESNVKNARHNLLLVLIFTVINILLLVSNANTYFLFSAYIPYGLVDYGMFFGGMYPSEVYGEYISEILFLGTEFFATMIAIAAVVFLLYVLCWIFAKKNPKPWLIVALVLFSIDTAVLLLWLEISADLILDYVVHGWVIVSLAKGLSALKKLKNLPEEVVEPAAIVDIAPAEEAQEMLSVEE